MAGAAGYLLKRVTGIDLVDAVRTVSAGGSLLDPQAAGAIMERLRSTQRCVRRTSTPSSSSPVTTSVAPYVSSPG
jgi:DNA-binding NarL/FixJ family response regulator